MWICSHKYFFVAPHLLTRIPKLPAVDASVIIGMPRMLYNRIYKSSCYMVTFEHYLKFWQVFLQ